jgi:uncharacterized protein (TIGR03435 family)
MIRPIPFPALLFTIALCCPASAQPAFDAAAVKPNRTGRTAGSTSRSGGRLTFDNTSLRECIAFANAIPPGRDYALSGPAWLASDRFDIAATFPPATSRDGVRQMMRTLLAQRFGLRTHPESKKLKVYVLVGAKQGPRLKPAANGVEENFTFADDHITARAMSMSSFADHLSGYLFNLDRPVMDQTGIQGVYDFTLNWSPDTASAETRPAGSIFTALQEQLGLKLELGETTVTILVVDHADRLPVGN